jgi:Icc-related predicted phosphoesterase
LIFKKKKRGKGKRIFFATDLHGSERCFRKWLNAHEAYQVEMLVMGGDIAGKALVPIVQTGSSTWEAEIRGETRHVADQASRDELLREVRMMGYYALEIDADEKDALDADPEYLEATFRQVMVDTLARWMDLADERLPEGFPAVAMLGNDDYPELARPIIDSRSVYYGESGIFELPDGTEILSMGFSNPTPWDSPRELSEEMLKKRLDSRVSELKRPEKAIFNIHCPPYDTRLDQAPALDTDFRPKAGMDGGVQLASVGSTAVRGLIEEVQPVLSLHGHVHESTGDEKLGRTVTVNPGSTYMSGMLRGVLIELDSDGEVKSWQMTEG